MLRISEIIGLSKILNNDEIDKYRMDWTKGYIGGSFVVKPESVKDITDIMKYCYIHHIAVVPQGGNTGLVGGQVGFGDDEIILSLENLNKIISIDPVAAVAVVESGCVLENLSNEVEKFGYILPIDLGSKGSCQIGGNVSTNAGGLRLLRYGSLHQNILGLEVVKSDGQILNMLRTLHKDNCGYHLKNLFIGKMS
jgi:D-2-hydroxyglutarate dehydrogenase